MIRIVSRASLFLFILSTALWSAKDVPKAVLVLRFAGAADKAVENFRQQYGNNTFQIVVAGEQNAASELLHADIAFFEHPNPQFLREIRPAMEASLQRGFIALTDTPEIINRQWNYSPPAEPNNRVRSYWDFGGVENLTNMLAVMYQAAGGARKIHIAPPKEEMVRGVYHPRAPRLFPNLKEYLAWYRKAMPSQGKLAVVTFFHNNIRSQETQVVDALLTALERQGLAAAGVFGWPHSTVTSVLETPSEDPVCVNLSFTLALSKPEDAVALERQGVHVIGLMTTRMSYDEWAKSDRGVTPDRLPTSLNSPERNGATDPIMVATQEADPRTGLAHIAPIAERIEMAAHRAKRWIVLREKPNREKRLVILYYNNPPGKGNIGASYLNLPPSIVAVLNKLHDAGYFTGNQLPSAEELIKQLERVGRNIELWAPGELERLVEQGGVTLIPVEQYRLWFNKLPKQFRDSINARWGPPEAARLMTLTARDGRKLFVIPGVRLGNIFLGPQLLRSSSEEYTNVQHSGTLPPHHAYVAAYLYYRHQFGADAVVHMGRHGTLEWLPGKNAGQAGWDSSEVILGDLPNANYYIMDGGGEALQARRRSAAVDISHLTPMLASGGKQEQFAALQKAIDNWTSTRETSPSLAAQYQDEALAEARRLHLDTQLSLPTDNADAAMEQIFAFLETTEEAPIPLGLPILGQMPDEFRQREGLLKLLQSGFTNDELKLVRSQLPAWSGDVFENRSPHVPDSLSPELRAKVFKLFDEASTWLHNLHISPDRELASLIDVLNERFLPSGLVGDPLGVPAALPSGRNLHDTDPSQFPTKQAWELGKKMANQLIDRYRQEHNGAFPERTSMVLWSGETGRHQGTMEAEALYLMGVAPEWNARGTVDRVKLIADAELGRPRVNVIFTASGLYRDSFGDKILLLDRAARIAAAAGENALSKQNREVETELLAQGISAEDAKYLAGARVFATAPGAYGTGMSQMVEQSRDKDEHKTMTDLYLSKMNFVYTEKAWGTSAPHLFSSHLKGNQMILHSRSSNLYGVADNDDVYQFVGGLNIASKSVGAKPDILFNNLRARGKERLEDARHTLATELTSRNWNPKWIKAMKESGYSGAREMVNSVEYLYGWQATAPESVDPSVWKRTYDVYVADEHHLGLPEFLSKSNPHAQQKLYARLLEVSRQGIYQFTKQEQAKLLEGYVRSVSQQGVACSANICGNERLQKFVVQEGQTLNSQQLSQSDLSSFRQQFKQAASPHQSAANSSTALKPSPRRSRPNSSWLKNVPLMDLNPSHSFLKRPFGVAWFVWLLCIVSLAGVCGCLYPVYRRRRQFWSSNTLFSGRNQEL